ncbi:hypothetical protein HMPREF0298_1921, partial [Corynebacterium lipophiloflavum DSM 44291]
HRAAPDNTRRAKGNETVTVLGRDPGRQGDVSRTVGSGRDGTGRAGLDRTGLGNGRRRRGKRGGKSKRDG